MPLPPILTAPYDTIESVLNLARVRINDAIASIQGDILKDNQPFTLEMANAGWRTLQEFLDGYLSRAKQNYTEALPQAPAADPTAPEPWDDGPPIEAYAADALNQHGVDITDDDIPF